MPDFVSVLKCLAVVFALVLLLLIVVGALKTIRDPKFPWVRKWDEQTRSAYIALTITSVALFAFGALDIHIQSIEMAGIKASVGNLQQKVNTLSEQMKAFFAQKIVESFDEHNWDQVRVVHASGHDVVLEVTLKQKPIPGSVEVFEGPMPMPEQGYHVDGMTLQFPANTAKPTSGLTIKYYPDLSDAAK